jgi:magnesium transporter
MKFQNGLNNFKKNKNLFARTSTTKKSGQPPGTLLYTGSITEKPILISLLSYDPEYISSISSNSIEDILIKYDKDRINWINIDALYNIDIIDKIGQYFNLHSLILEDILNTEHHPKIDFEDDYIFITMKMLSLDRKNEVIDNEHVSFILGENYIISFQEKSGDVFDPIRKRLENGKGKARKRKADYLLYLLMDSIVDNYYHIFDYIYDKIEDLEESIYYNPKSENFEKIIFYKKQLIYLRKSIFPLESVLREITDEDINVIETEHNKFFSDIYDHLKSIMQDLEIMREVLTGLIDLYMSSLSNKMNNIMKTLTVVAAIFIPLTFLAGVYGMNFKYMPELEWHWGYPLILIIMACLGIGMFFLMKYKKWF